MGVDFLWNLLLFKTKNRFILRLEFVVGKTEENLGQKRF